MAAACGAGEHIRRGDQLAGSGLYEEALAQYELAEREAPSDPEVKLRLHKTRKKLADAEIEEGRQAILSGDFWAALGAFKKALGRLPNESAYKQALKQAAKMILGQGRKAVQEKRYRDAISLYERLLGELPRLAPATQGLEEARSAWASMLLMEAKRYQNRHLYGNALIELIKLRKISSSYGDSAAAEQESRSQLAAASTFSFRVKPGRVKRPLVTGTAEMVRRIAQVTIPGCPNAGPAIEGDPRAVLTVELKGLDYSTGRETSEGQHKYQSGTRPVDNPAFLELETKIASGRERVEKLSDDIQKTEKELEQLRQAFADAGPEADEAAMRKRLVERERTLAKLRKERTTTEDQVLALRNKLSDTPRMLDEPVYDIHRYEVHKVTRTATASASVSARVEGSRLFSDEVFSGVASSSDDTHKPNLRYGLKGDPLAFPASDRELAEQAYDAAAQQVAKRMGGLCKTWKERILERARQASGSGATLEAIEDFVLYLLVTDDPPPQDVRELLEKQRDFQDLEALRKRP
ncbi:MAG: hypothetical protein JXR96_27395 [Deltaproteobacteria bacterium]|nr:hypothetical protein [Deltaproteobacteria bacterium]